MGIRQSKLSIGFSATFDSATQAGNTLVAILCSSPVGMASITLTDSKGNSVAGARKVSTDGGGGISGVSIWVLENIANFGSGHALTASGVDQQDFATMSIVEIDNAPASSYDASVTATARDTDGSPYALTTGTPSQAGDLVLAAIISEGSTALDFAASGWTRYQQQGDFTTYWGQADFWKTADGSAQAFSATATGGSSNMLLAAVGIKQNTAPVVSAFASQTASVGGTATFAPSYSGSPTSYQWKLNGVNISGATGASYTTPTLAAADNGGFYSVVATSGSGSSAEVGAYVFIRDQNTGDGDKLNSAWVFKHGHESGMGTMMFRKALVAGMDASGGAGRTIWSDWWWTPASGAYVLVADPAAYAVAAQPVGLTIARQLSVDPVAYSVAAPDAAMVRGLLIPADPAAYAVTAQPVSFSRTYVLSADPGVYSVAAAPVNLAIGRLLSADPASYTVVAQPASLVVARALLVDPAAYSVAAQPVSLLTARLLLAAPAAYAVAAQPVAMLRSNLLAADPAAYSVTAAPVTMTISSGQGVDPVAYTVTAAPVAMLISRQLQVSPAAYAVAAAPAAALIARVLGVSPATYSLGLPPAAMTASRLLSAAPAAYSVTPAPVGFSRDYVMAADPASYQVQAADAAMLWNRITSIDPAAYQVQAFDVTFEKGSAFPFAFSNRVLLLPGEDRYITIPAEGRYISLPTENRFIPPR